jgi:hypothetical protein
MKEVDHLYGLIGNLREQLVVLSETSRKRNHSPSCSATPTTKKLKYG